MKIKTVGRRFRTDMGDIDGLADSINELGLLQPARRHTRLKAYRRVPPPDRLHEAGVEDDSGAAAHIERVINGEFMENAARKDFTLSGIAAIARELRPRVEADARERRRAGLKERWQGASDGESCPDRQGRRGTSPPSTSA